MIEAPVGTQSQAMQKTSGSRPIGGMALTLVLYALLLDAAVETFASGSPLRWWVVGIVLLYSTATVVVWRRMPLCWTRFGWHHRAQASFFVLLGLLALTAWLPAGQADGIVLATLRTSTVLAAVTGAALVLSIAVLLRALKRAPVWVRGTSGGLALYAFVAFGLGVLRHTPYSQLLAGASAWQRLPFWLQGAFLGAFVIVPAAVLAEIVEVARRIRAGSEWRQEPARLAALVLSVAMAVPALTQLRSGTATASAANAARFTFAGGGEIQQAAAVRLVDEPPRARNVDSVRLLEKVDAVVRGFHPEEWKLGALGGSLGNDPSAAFAFVRDAIGFDAYAGVLRGTEGTLAARAGNSWDRALLLRALLVQAGARTRLAFTTLDNRTAARVVARAHQRPSRKLSVAPPAGLLARAVTGIAARARRDEAALRLALGGRTSELGVDESEALRQDAARHAWVQVQKGDRWIDFDPTFPDAEVGKPVAAAARTAEEVPPEQQQSVVVRVVAESLIGNALSETVSLERELPAAAAARQHIVLGFRSDGAGGSPAGSFVPTLWVGGQAQAGRAIATTLGGGQAGFGSFFGGGAAAASSELTGLFIDVETRVPGRQPTRARHVLLDRVPVEKAEAWRGSPGSRSAAISAAGLKPPDGVAPRAFGGFHHLLISTGGSSPFDMARLRLSSVEAAQRPDADAEGPDGADTVSVSATWVADLTLVEGSERLIVQAFDSSERGRVYVDQPRVFLASWIPGKGANVSRETDLLIDSVRILPPDGASLREVAARHFRYGALQSALETETALHLAEAWEPEGRRILSTSLVTPGRLTVLTPGDVGRLPARAAGALRRALRAGDSAVVPGDVAAATVWWTVARSGFVRAIMEPGTGGTEIAGLIAPVGPAQGSGDRPGRGGAGYQGLVNQQAKTAIKVAKKVGKVVRDVFQDANHPLNPLRYQKKLPNITG